MNKRDKIRASVKAILDDPMTLGLSSSELSDVLATEIAVSLLTAKQYAIYNSIPPTGLNVGQIAKLKEVKIGSNIVCSILLRLQETTGLVRREKVLNKVVWYKA